MIAIETILNDLESYLIHEGFYKLLEQLDDDKPIFNYDMESIYQELSIIKSQMKKKKSISQLIMELLNEKNIYRESALYIRINIERKHWSKLKSGLIKEPTLRVLYKLAIGFNLSLEETNNFLKNFNRAFSLESDMTDQILVYFISHEIYEPVVIDQALDHFGEKEIFSTKN